MTEKNEMPDNPDLQEVWLKISDLELKLTEYISMDEERHSWVHKN